MGASHQLASASLTWRNCSEKSDGRTTVRLQYTCTCQCGKQEVSTLQFDVRSHDELLDLISLSMSAAFLVHSQVVTPPPSPEHASGWLSFLTEN